MVEQLVQRGARAHGRFDQRPVEVNPLDEFAGLRRMWRVLRLKQWIGFTLVHPDVWSSMLVQDAGYLASSEIYAHDASTGGPRQHSANARGGAGQLPTKLLGERAVFHRPGHRIDYEFADRADGTHHVRVDVSATRTDPAISGELALHAGTASPALSVSAPLPGGSMYTHKAVFPTSGTLRVGDREHKFDAGRDFAILDEHKSFLPYRTRWLWGTFATRTSHGVVGANFAQRPAVPGSADESCLWTPGAVEPLAEVTFERDSDDPLSGWRARSANGRLDVRFEAEGRKTAAHQLGLFAIDYFQLYGRWSGVVGEHTVTGAHGVCESMDARL